MMPSPATQDEPSSADLRAEARTHLFLAATLMAGGASTAVHIRNLSATGALVEGFALPDPGAAASIRRAGLAVEGIVAWKSGTQAGIAFKANISVPSWLPRTANSGQCAVDRMVFDAKKGLGVAAKSPGPREPLTQAFERTDLALLRSELVALGDALIKDADLVAAHPEIQLLDIALQRVDRLLRLAGATAPLPARRKA